MEDDGPMALGADEAADVDDMSDLQASTAAVEQSDSDDDESDSSDSDSSDSSDSSDDDSSDSQDYYNAPFHHAEHDENDLQPHTFPNMQMVEKPEVKKPVVKKPIEETTKTPNSPWLQLNSEPIMEERDENDINFDVDDKFKFRMQSD